MKEFQGKQKIRRVIYSIPLLIVLSIVAFLLVKGAVRVANKERESSERSRDLGEKTAALVLREQELREGIARLKTEEGVKDEIKERFSVTQEDEYVAIIIDEKRSSTSTDASLSAWYRRFWDAIMTRITTNEIE